MARVDALRCERWPMLDRLLSDHDIERLTGRARSTLQKDRVAGTGIPFVRIGRLVRYRPSDVAAFLAALPSNGTAAPENDDGSDERPE